MDDLAGLDWGTTSQQPNKPQPLNATANYYPTLKPTPPLSGRSTPVLSNLPKAPATPANASTPQTDSFANLLPSFSSNQTTKNLSLKEQQALLEEQKRQKALQQSRQWESLGVGSASTSASVSRNASPAPFSVQALNSQSSGHNLPLRSITPSQQGVQPLRKQSEDVEDILAAFNASAPVDRSTNFPVPSRPDSRNVAFPTSQTSSNTGAELLDDEDDPFGLGTAATKSFQQAPVRSASNGADEDDVLGLLGKPVSELPPPKSSSPIRNESGHPVDKAVAELVDMGFSAEKARIALDATESGIDVQAAVGFLLNQAHSQSRSKSQTKSGQPNGSRSREVEQNQDDALGVRTQRTGSRQRDEDNRSAQSKDAAKYASEIGNNLFKTANSLWKAGQKKVNKAMADFNTEGDSSQPKWMRDATLTPESSTARSRPQPQGRTSSKDDSRNKQIDNLTDEAALLEMGGGRPQPAKSKRPVPQPRRTSTDDFDRPVERNRPQDISGRDESSRSRFADQNTPAASAARARLTREMNDETTAYVSPARRKKTTPRPSEPEPALLFDDGPMPNSVKSSQTPPPRTVPATKKAPPRAATTTPIPPKPKPAPRKVLPLEASVLSSSTTHRVAGTAAFKLGNYADAHASYTAALRDIPKEHPLTIVLLTNRSLTSLKTGDPKQSIADADQAIAVIGPARGANESITIGGDEGIKDMAPYWGKAMMRRAEAMEQLERWADAAKVWKECVEAGVGGAQSVQGRSRCEKASGTGSASQPVSRKPTPAPKKPTPRVAPRSALDDLSGKPMANAATDSEAVTRLRAANDAAAKLDDERFALTDAVADRVEKWKKGKEQNLRALLGSLDTVLWADSGWKKVGMSELLNPSKVKINYMKGIAKVHPDKLPPTATTEQIMISGAVFSTLNEAWDGFKKENGL